MDHQDVGLHPPVAQLLDRSIGGGCLSAEFEPGHTGRGDDAGCAFQYFTNDADLDGGAAIAGELLDAVGRQKRCAIGFGDIGGQVLERGPGKHRGLPVVEFRIRGARTAARGTATVLHPEQVGGAPVEFVISDRRKVRIDEVVGKDGGLVQEQAGRQRCGPDGVSRKDGDSLVLVQRLLVSHHFGQRRRPTCVLAVQGAGGAPIQVSVEIVVGQDVNVGGGAIDGGGTNPDGVGQRCGTGDLGGCRRPGDQRSQPHRSDGRSQ